MTARDILNIAARAGCIHVVNGQHVYVDWEKLNTELLLMFRIGIDNELMVDDDS